MNIKAIKFFCFSIPISIFVFGFFFALPVFAQFPDVCEGLDRYVPSLADPDAGKCPPGQNQISPPKKGCPSGEQLMGCGKEALGANIPVFGCCEEEPPANITRCTPKSERVNTCEAASKNPKLSYECLPIAQKPKCDSVGGEMVLTNPTTYPGCGSTDRCCISEVCPDQPAAPASDDAPAQSAPSSYTLTNPLGTTSLTIIAQRVINTFLGIVGALALIVFIYGGVTYIIAGGNDQRVQKAKDTLRYGVIGVFFIMFAFVLTDTFVKLWTVDIGPPTAPGPGEFLNQPTEAEQEVTSLKEQQDAAQQAENDAIAEAKKSKTDVCGQTPATQGYSCMTLTTQEQANYDCLSSYC
ncbi:hypothetical protein GF391_02230, partial [Candidatus Uhrbacteria bacterium]|nr:hypothetical protein [Candidatus Uhrbacteria bacterium]